MINVLSREVVDPASVGVHARRQTSSTVARYQADVEQGPLPSAQIAVARNGRVATFETYGDATPETRYITQSAGRPLLAAVVWKLMGDGLLDVDQPVSSLIPEFGANGKGAISSRQVLTHTGGFPMAPIRFEAMVDRSKRLAAMLAVATRLEPGTMLRYHLTSAAWVVADTVEAITGMPLKDYLQRDRSAARARSGTGRTARQAS